ncbi:MAG: hypothetical protein Q7S00_04480 [bacterium]|nr:hypothetical protein [bacterium]
MPPSLEDVWKKIPKTLKEGKEYIRYGSLDIPYLYLCRFADPRKCTYQEWIDSFKECQQKDGTYLISHEQFLAKEKYFNTRQLTSLFDLSALREGLWPEAEFERLYVEKIQDELCMNNEDWEAIKNKIRRQTPNGPQLLITKEFKQELKAIIEKLPTMMRLKFLQDSGQKPITPPAVPQGFQKGPSVGESVVRRFRDFLRFGKR